jgi:hypothetical protein
MAHWRESFAVVLARIAFTAVAYALLARVSLQAAVLEDGSSLLWLPAGVAVGLTYWWGYRVGLLGSCVGGSPNRVGEMGAFGCRAAVGACGLFGGVRGRDDATRVAGQPTSDRLARCRQIRADWRNRQHNFACNQYFFEFIEYAIPEVQTLGTHHALPLDG